MLTALSLYLTSTDNGNGRSLASSAPSSETSTTCLIGTTTGYGELRAQGNTGAWAGAVARPDPSGYGFLWDVTTLEGEGFPVGLWHPVIKLNTSHGTVGCDVYVRLLKLNAGGSYELVATAVASGITITAATPQVVTPTPIQGYLMDFGTDEKLYLDVLVDITANNSSNAAATISIYEAGGANESVLSPGYDDTPTVPSKTVLDLCTASARKLQLLYQGQSLSASDGEVLLDALNALIDRMNADRTALFAMKFKRYTLTAHKGTYSIGIGATDFNEARPILIQPDGVSINIGGLAHPIKTYTQPEWTQIRETTNEQVCPEGLYCDYNWPVATIRLNGVPTGATTTYLDMWSWQGIPLFGALTDSVDLPPAYYEALVYNLAVSAAPEFDKEPTQVVAAKAQDAKMALSQFNAMQIPGALAAMAQAAAMQQQQGPQKQ